MKFNQKTNRLELLFWGFLIFFGGCKQSDFFDKSLVLDNINKDAEDNANNISPDDPNSQSPKTGSSPTPNLQNPSAPNQILEEKSETFIQNTSRDGDVDILWVIDDSGSMADNQEALGKNFDLFINQFIEKNIDFKMAITTTDGTEFRNGRMVGDSNRLTRASANGNKQAFINNFRNWIKVGTSGSGVEQGLKCASGFLDRYASSFLRKDAFLIIVFVSDENDQSEQKVSDYIKRFQSVKNQRGMVKAYSIVTQNLPPNSQWETIGTRYNEVSNATGGLTNDITNDFAITLKEMGGKIVNLVDSFALSTQPFENQIRVYVNNKEIKNGWIFDSVSRTLKFDSSQIPTEGSSVEIKYRTKPNVLGAI